MFQAVGNNYTLSEQAAKNSYEAKVPRLIRQLQVSGTNCRAPIGSWSYKIIASQPFDCLRFLAPSVGTATLPNEDRPIREWTGQKMLKMEAHTRANQLLPEFATLTGIDLGARIIEEAVFDKGAELRIPVVICACDYLPR